MINLSNYEEYFILYMDNELSAEEKLMVDNFILQHPQLSEEFEVLMSTKLPLHEINFPVKNELFSAAMKINTVDESLLLYIDHELPALEQDAVASKIAADKDYAQQFSLLMETKLDPSEKILHPNKKELYRHTEKRLPVKVWMRIAAAVMILLFGSLYFLLSKNEKPADQLVVTTPPFKQAPVIVNEKTSPTEEALEKTAVQKEERTLVKSVKEKAPVEDPAPLKQQQGKYREDQTLASSEENIMIDKPREIVSFDPAPFRSISLEDSFNKPITASAVTIDFTQSYNPIDDSPEPAVTDGDFKNTKKTPAKGFFRKVSRFIERNTGIGTVNADNELLIGAVSLKLK